MTVRVSVEHRENHPSERYDVSFSATSFFADSRRRSFLLRFSFAPCRELSGTFPSNTFVAHSLRQSINSLLHILTYSFSSYLPAYLCVSEREDTSSSADSCCNDAVCRARRLLLQTCQTLIADTKTSITNIMTSAKTCTSTSCEIDDATDVDAELEQLPIRGRDVFAITLKA